MNSIQQCDSTGSNSQAVVSFCERHIPYIHQTCIQITYV